MHELITATDNGTMAGNLQPPEAESSMFYEFFIAKFQQKEIDSKQIWLPFLILIIFSESCKRIGLIVSHC